MTKLNRILFVVAPLLALVFTSCTRPIDIPIESTYSFTNESGKAVTLDVYDTEEDYNADTNYSLRYRIAAGATQQLVLKVAENYWLDWYSDDYSVNNWSSAIINYAQAGSGPRVKLVVAAVDDHLSIWSNGDTARSVLFEGRRGYCEWETKLLNVAKAKGTHRFLFRKDFTALYTYTSATGDETARKVKYQLIGVKTNYFRIYVMDSTVQIADIYYNADPASYPHFSRDTLMVNIRAQSYYDYYPAVRL
jgi:hypothetical protein